MGDIAKVAGTMKLPEPEGWNPPKGQFNLPFAIELKEDWHIHWADMRIEMTSKDFEGFALAIGKSYEQWKKDGKPETLPEMKRYGVWPGEDGMDHFKGDDRNNPYSPSNELRFHFKKFPRTETGKLFFEPIFQIELQKAGWYHLHYKNFRIEMNKQMLKEMSEIFNKATE